MSARSGRRIRKPSVRLRDSNFVVPGLSSEGTDDSAATKTVNFNPPRLMGVANGEDVLNPLLREEARQEGQAKSFRVFKGALRFHVAKVKFEEKKRDREYEVKTEKSKVADAKTRKGGSGIKVEEEEEQYAEGASSTPQSRELERNSGQAEMSAEIVMAPVSQTPMSGGFNGGEKVVKGEKLKRAADATPTAVPSKAQKREDNLIIVDGTKYVECQVCHKNLKLGCYKQHLQTHQGVKRFFCDVPGCSVRFTRRGDVSRHKTVVHINKKHFPCDICNRKFKTEKERTEHKENHASIYHVCPTCGYRFTNKRYWSNHVKFIHPQPNAEQKEDEPNVDDVSETEDVKGADSISEVQSVSFVQEEEVVHEETIPLPVDKSQQVVILTQEQYDQLQEMGSIVSADQLPEAAEGKQGLSPGPVARTLASLSPPPTAASVPSDDSTSTSTALLTSAATFPPSSTVPNTEANVLESEEADEESGSPDAVQTLIDAVQELIQTHDQAGANK